ncbi:ArsR/SmtB family transcription factor [Actinomadura rupiterrae]|uniref:ArsR/SmtB family transcription factor n=1 Tax=Actinomadura rupiterrae TaxID=559627 RepID=UPI0020A40EBD|nr:DUF5937 family protein [Actinomadura rupiterrae]MCP2342286.1 DNA-binding transcriptional ArsR family regulator [Actinomadura rupiterrae]
MLELAFSAQDVAQTRLACSPLNEAVMSVRALKDPAHHALHLPWIKNVRDWLPEADLRLLDGLVPAADRTPDFVTPPPGTPLPDLADELDRLRATPPDQVRRDLDGMTGPRPRALAELYADPAAGLGRLADEIVRYWETALAPDWPRIRSVLEGDILHRARRIAEGGADLLFRDLHAQVEWRPGTLYLSHRPYSHTRTGRGLGLLLVPSVFAWPRIFTQTSQPWQPMLIYPARGAGTLWESRATASPRALEQVLGRSRARLLTELDAPATTTDLAGRLGMTTGGASQHLTALRDAHLVTAHRDRRLVLYARSPLGDALLNGRLPDAAPLTFPAATSS